MFSIRKFRVIVLLLIGCILLGCTDDIDLPLSKNAKVKFVNTLGGSMNDAANSVIPTQDGGYSVFGFTQSMDGDIVDKTVAQYDYWLLKFDSNDNLEWQKTYGGSKDDRGQKVIQTSDLGYAIIGYSRSDDQDVSNNEGFQDVWVLKLDNSGNILWQKSIGFSGDDRGFSILQTSDDGFFISGILDVSASGGQGNKISIQKRHAGGDYWGLKLDANGNTEWRNYYGGTNTDTCYDVIDTSDGFILVGSSDSDDVDISSNKGSYDFWLVKIDNTGTLIWEKSFGGNEIEAAFSIKKTNDGNFIVVGDTRSDDQDVTLQHGAADIWLVKINSSGTILWEKTYGGSGFDAARAISLSADGGYILAGSSRSSDMDVSENKGQNDVWVIKVDSNGKLVWEKSIGGSEIDFAYGVTELQNGGIIVVGESNSADQDIIENKGFTDNLIIRIDEE